METVNFLKFLNSVQSLSSLEYASCSHELVNFMDVIAADEQFTRNIDLGIVFLSRKTSGNYIIVDGLSRFLSLSLLLHAVCECYKKTTPKNEKAIKTIRAKYLYQGKKTKLRLSGEDNVLYNKIISGERLSGHEKSTHMFCLLHDFWLKIKEEKLQAGHIFTMLNKINITLVDSGDVSKRNLYYKLNSGLRTISQELLIDDFLDENGVLKEWAKVKESYFVQKDDQYLFLKDFFITKFNYKTFNPERMYETFVNYFDTMKQYMPEKKIIQKIAHSAMLYFSILNLELDNENIKKALINIKKHGGEDTYPYILNVYEDYSDNNISESIFLEILNTIDEYLINRQKNGKSIDFNELISYLNTFITLK